MREPCRYLEEHDYGITYLPVDDNARLDPADVEDALRNDTILVSVMLANNEVGTIQPLEEIAEILRKEDVLLHTDAAQAIGKIPVDVNELGVDFLSIAGHKFYAPKGVGALYCRESDLFEPLVHGADHEQGLRAGTENVIFDVGLGKACEIADPGHEANRLESLRDDFHERLKDVFGDRLVLNGHPEHRLPNTLNVNFTGRDAGALLNQVEGVAASTGSACHSDRVELSPVLSAMGVDPEVGKGAVRFSLGRFTTEQDLEPAVEALRVADQALGK